MTETGSSTKVGDVHYVYAHRHGQLVRIDRQRVTAAGPVYIMATSLSTGRARRISRAQVAMSVENGYRRILQDS